MLERELEDYRAMWNTHVIRPSRMSACPSGRPDDMFDCLVSNAIAFPRKVKAFCAGGNDCRQPVANQTLLYAEQNIAQRPGPYFDQNLYNSCSIITWNKFHLCVTSSLAVNTCTNIYKHLVNFLPF